MKTGLKSGILSADKSADCRPTVGGAYVIAVVVIILFLSADENRAKTWHFIDRSSADKSADCLPTVGGVNVIGVLTGNLT